MVVLAGLGYLTPDLLLRWSTASHRKLIQRSLPDAIDLLMICVEAGLGVDQALLRVTKELEVSHPAIAGEFVLLNLEQRAGKTRTKAWQSMADRLELAEIDSFVNMLVQTERFGTPIVKAMSNFAETMREKRRQVAEEKAAKPPLRLSSQSRCSYFRASLSCY